MQTEQFHNWGPAWTDTSHGRFHREIRQYLGRKLGLSATAILIVEALVDQISRSPERLAQYNLRPGQVFRSIADLADDVGCGPTAAKNALKVLQSEGLIIQVRRGSSVARHASVYDLTPLIREVAHLAPTQERLRAVG